MPASLWLRPEPDTAAALDAAIAGYARVAGRTLFPAHLTLASGDDSDAGAIALMCRGFSPLLLKPEGVLQAGTFFQAFALRFGESPAIRALQARARQCLNTDRISEYPPHLSLTYGSGFDEAVLTAIAKRFAAPIRFDRMRLVRYDALEATQAGVAAWRYGEDMPLTG